MLDNRAGRASGIGSWPGTDVKETLRTVLGELGDPGIPHLAELPARGPGSDLLGRGAVLLAEMPVDLQPSGWRLVSHPGRDLERARAMLREDLDVLAEIADGYTGPLKIQVTGPWTLAAGIHLPRLDVAVADRGACRDIVEALAEGVSRHVHEVRRLVPGAEVVVQVDEPSIRAVLAGDLPTASGLGRLRAVGEQVVQEGLRTVLGAAKESGAVETLVHCCAASPPSELFTRAGADGISADLGLLSVRDWELLAPHLERGLRLWAGAVPVTPVPRDAAAVADAVWTPWNRLTLDTGLLDAVVITPTCGLATVTPATARAAVAAAVAGARELGHRAEG